MGTRSLLVFLLVALSSPAFTQAPGVAVLPADPLEPATGDTLKVANPENRASVLNLLRNLAAGRMYPPSDSMSESNS